MTGQQYGNGDYKFSWSSESEPGMYPINVFDGIALDKSDKPGGAWGHNQFDRVTGAYLGSNYVVQDYRGDWIKMYLPEAITLSYVKVYLRDSYQHSAPFAYRVYGSNDAVEWTQLIDVPSAEYVHEEVAGSSYLFSVSTVFVTGTRRASQPYSRYAFVINKIPPGTEDYLGGPHGGNTNFDELEFYTLTQVSEIESDGPVDLDTAQLTG